MYLRELSFWRLLVYFVIKRSNSVIVIFRQKLKY